ncbi:type VI secretion system protein ImpL [Alteromonadaceae bacterium Bs31]|nr:type VI secretion system protein ImpL [Alteromonadaceae bacterium Bs31]
MKKLKAFFLHPITIGVIGLILVSLLIWFAGPQIKFGSDNSAPLGSPFARLLCILVVVVLWGLNNLRIQLQANKQNNSLVADIQQNQKETVASTSNSQAAEEVQQLNQRFSEALGTLKKVKFGGQGSSKALYELPWYIIVGPPGSGKTTALVNSGLDFPLAEKFGKGALQGVGGTRNCDWWFTNEAVLLDTAGRYTTQDSHRVVDSSAWEGFLNLLKRNRRRRPINGAIVAISLHDLLIQTEEERAQNAKTIRSRLDELMEKLQIRFPVYLMFTKSDLVSGFSEFFEDLNREDRDQVWGVSLPNAPKASQSPDFDFLSAEMENIVSRLYDRVLWRVHQERDVKRRAAISGFPQQMENLKNLVDGFVRQTFAANRYQFQPYLRGVYFSSGTQDGTPIDRLMSSVSANFGFPREASALAHQQGKSFFLSRLFQQVIFPESELVGSNVKYERMILWTQRVAYLGLAGFTLATALIWSGSLTRHKMFMSDVQGLVDTYEEQSAGVNKRNRDVSAVVPSLNALEQASIVYNQEEHPWLKGMGMYDGRIDQEADAAYTVQLKELLLPRLINSLERNLMRGHKGGDLYQTFSVYMMFNKLEKMDKALVSQWFHGQWEQQFSGEATLRTALKRHLSALLEQDLRPVELNPRLVRDTRATLLRVPVSQRIYERAKNNPDYSFAVDMTNMFGESVRDTFNINSRAVNIPALYTIDVYENLDLDAQSPLIGDVEKERWLLANEDSEKVDYIQEDLDEISARVKEHYLADYSRTWLQLLQGIKVKPFNSISQANDVLLGFTDPVYSPLIAILQVTKQHTQLTIPVADMVEGKGEGKAAKLASLAASKVETTRVDKQFRDLHLLLRESRGGITPADTALQRIQQMQEFISEVAISPDPGQKSFQIAKARFQGGAGNPITALRAYAANQPKPVNEWLTSLADESWRVLLLSAHQYVNAEWKAQVYSSYREALAGRYPLNRSTSDEMAMFDFSAFFKPAGTLDLFFQENIAPFIDTRKGWSNKSVDNYSMGFSAASLKQIRKGLNIKSVLFRKSAEAPAIALDLKPSRMDEQHARFTLEVGGETLSYKHGPKLWRSLNWSGANENQRVRVIFQDLNDLRHDATYNGPWAWFRLMDASDIEKTNSTNVYRLRFKVDGIRGNAHEIEYLAKAKSINNPLRSDWLSSFRCPDSI